VNWLKDFFLNRHEGQLSFGIHRLTGILMAIYLIPHVFVNSFALLYGPEGYDRATEAAQRLHWLEILIILGVAFHMFNGIRITWVDFFRGTRLRRRLFYVAGAFTMLALFYSLYVYIPRMLGE
jgi:succinate dehydrogenase / fumarate reductase cytochrome b subunit